MQYFRNIITLIYTASLLSASPIKIEAVLQGYINTAWKFQKSSVKAQNGQIMIEITTGGPGGINHTSRYLLPNSRIDKTQAQVKTKTGHWVDFGLFQEDSGQIELNPQARIKTNLSETLLAIKP